MRLTVKALALIVLLIIFLFPDAFSQTRQEIGIVSDVNGVCWLSSQGTGKRNPIKKGDTFFSGDTLNTGVDGKIKILLWNGDQRKTLFSNNTFVVPAVESSSKKQKGILGSAFSLFKETYAGLANTVAESKSHEAAIRGIDEGKFFVLFPRNENVFKNDLKFCWMPVSKNANYAFRLMKDEKLITEKKTSTNELQLDIALKSRILYVWNVIGIDSQGKAFKDSASFSVLTSEEEIMISKEITAYGEISEQLSVEQKLLIRPIIYDKWNMYSKSLKEYGNLRKESGLDFLEIDSFIKLEYQKMRFPQDEKSFKSYIQWQSTYAGK